jgi:hypothetical protein
MDEESSKPSPKNPATPTNKEAVRPGASATLPGTTPEPTNVMYPATPTLPPVTVIYSGEANLAKTQGVPAKQWEAEFSTLELAKQAPLPDNATFASISLESGTWVRKSTQDRWEFIGR